MGLTELLDLPRDTIVRAESGTVPRSGRVLRVLDEWLEQDVPVPDPVFQDPWPTHERGPKDVVSVPGAAGRTDWGSTSKL